MGKDVGTVPRTVRLLDCPVEPGNDTIFAIPIADDLRLRRPAKCPHGDPIVPFRVFRLFRVNPGDE